MSALIAGFPIKNSLVIFCTTGRTIPVNGEKIRPDADGKATRLVDMVEMRPNTKGEKTRPIDVEGSTDVKGSADIEELTDAERLPGIEKLVVIYYKYQY